MSVDPDTTIRPKRLHDYIGQDAIKEQLGIFIEAARARQETLDHVLLFGPPGLGKTTLSHIIATEMNANIRETSAPALERAGDLAALLVSLQPNDVLFIDEIHRLHPAIEEVLYPAMEDNMLDILVEDGAQRKNIRLPLPPFTLVGATTRQGSLSAPLRDRFGIVQRLEFYTPEQLTDIVTRSAKIWNINLEEDMARDIAGRARGTPRIANRLLRRVRDFIQVKHTTTDPTPVALVNEALMMLGVNEAGLDNLDQKMLSMMIDQFQGGPVGVETLAASLSEDRQTIEDVVEPYLLQQGYLLRTPRGRVLTNHAYLALGRTPPLIIKE